MFFCCSVEGAESAWAGPAAVAKAIASAAVVRVIGRLMIPQDAVEPVVFRSSID
jgi:hypothetical protein